MSALTERLAEVTARIERTGRNPGEITIVAVTKGFDASVCAEAVTAGLTVLGENRVQEAISKMEALGKMAVRGATWHLIGHLQTNKVRHAAGHFALIQSVDSLRLAEALARLDGSQQVLIEVNVAREPQRSGADPAAARDLISAAVGLLDVRGLMAIGPTQGDPGPAFRELARIRSEAEQQLGRALPVLSIGMSGDFEAALAAGSTMLRLGQALFGPRPTQRQ